MVESPVRPVCLPTLTPAQGEESYTHVLPTGYVTWERYLAHMDKQEPILAEWEDGKIIELPMPKKRHQKIAGLLFQLMEQWADLHEFGGDVLTPPFPMKISSRRGREPDVLYVREENAPGMEDNHIVGGADIAVEIVSEGGRKRDYETKLFEYEAAGVREYWIIDPEIQVTQFYRLDETGRFRRIPLTGENASIYRSEVLSGLEIDTDWLWQERLPAVRKIVATWEPAQEA